MSKRTRSISTANGEAPEPYTQYDSSKKQPLEITAPAVPVMRCSLPPHREVLSFYSFEDYEVHYKQAHVNCCLECGRNFPTERFLNLHIEENHDPLVSTLRERGEKTVCSAIPSFLFLAVYIPYYWMHMADGVQPQNV